MEFEGALYHLCARGNERQKVYRGDRDRSQFLEMVELMGTEVVPALAAA